MKNEDQELLAAYGEAMLYSHLIEDMLKLILRDAAFFHVNEYQAPAKQPWGLENIIDEFGRAFPDSATLTADLHRLKKIRNKLTHALVPQVGSDMLTEVGRDQIHAMFSEYIKHASARHRFLSGVFRKIVESAIAHDPLRIFEREESNIIGKVSDSDIQFLLNELGNKNGG